MCIRDRYNRKEIKPKVGAKPSDIWLFNGRELIPQVGGASVSVEWLVEGNKIRSKVGSASGNNTYELNGHPLLVAFGQVVLKLW